MQQRSYKRSLKAALSAAKKSPRSAVAFNIAGIAASATGRQTDAIKYFRRAIEIDPALPDAEKNLAQTLILTGRADKAVQLLSVLVQKSPEDWKVWFLKAQAEFGLGKERAALSSSDEAIAKSSGIVTIHHLRSTINLRLGHIKDAIIDLQKVLQINPNDVTALTNLSLPLARQAQSQDALRVVQKAVELDPNNIPARVRLASQYVEMGKPEEGIRHFKIALEIQQYNSAALEQLAHLFADADAAALEPKIRKALEKAPKKSEDRASLLYALSAALAANNESAEAEKTLGLANKEMAHLFPYEAEADAAVTNAILARFPSPMKVEETRRSSCRPIFVIGLPRSGTTLVEAILGAHPNVVPLGERGTAGFLLRDTIEQDLPFTPEAAAELVKQDQRLLPDLPVSATAYVDKMPENYRLVGFLKQAYPDCKIINVQRDPRDIALSMWRSHFSGSVLSYTYDWDWMAAKFNLYASSMEHWRSVLSGEILDVRYEKLVENVEGIGRQMADFCDLEWHAKMARPDLSTDQILTLSATQLRMPVHKGSVGKWREKAGLLEQFCNGLDTVRWSHLLNS
nr:tetratricopeptide repeat-containing sulfotransferase family protein [Sulfitobacter mediterraneus]